MSQTLHRFECVDSKDQFTNREKYWMHEAYTSGFNEAIKNCG